MQFIHNPVTKFTKRQLNRWRLPAFDPRWNQFNDSVPNDLEKVLKTLKMKSKLYGRDRKMIVVVIAWNISIFCDYFVISFCIIFYFIKLILFSKTCNLHAGWLHAVFFFSVICQLPDKPYHPPCNYKFPNNKGQSCSARWFKDWKWLHYRPSNDTVVCFNCASAYERKQVNKVP